MNRKIRSYCLILSFIYVFVVVYTILTEMAGFKAGFDEGLRGIPREIVHVNLIPKDGSYSFPDKVSDVSGNIDVRMEMKNTKLLVLNPVKLPVGIRIGYILILTSAFIMLGCTIWLPFLFFKIVRAASKGNILDMKVIKRIRKIGVILIFFYIADVLACVIDTLKAEYLLKLDNYNFFIDFSGFGTLILGIVTLLLAEILHVTLKMKEEQDLTI